jgi:hypothetical protein
MEQPCKTFHPLLVHRTPTLESLPAEIINCIAQHVRALSQDYDDYMPRVPRVCPCKPITPLRRAYAQVVSLGCYQDATLALSMVCRRMREIVFVAQLGRSIRIGLCDAAMDESRGISAVLRNHVRYVLVTFSLHCHSLCLSSYSTLHIEADPSHELPALVIQLNDYLRLFPSLVALGFDWKLATRRTSMRLMPSHLVNSSGLIAHPLKELRLVLKEAFSDPARSSWTTGALLSEMKSVLNHLVLPNLESLALELDLDTSMKKNESSWLLVLEKIKVIHRFKNLDRLGLRLIITIDTMPAVDHLVSSISLEFPMGSRVTKLERIKDMTTQLCTIALARTRITRLDVSLTFFMVPTLHVRHLIRNVLSLDSLDDNVFKPKSVQLVHFAKAVAKAHSPLQSLIFEIRGETGDAWPGISELLGRVSYTKPPANTFVSDTETSAEFDSQWRSLFGIYLEVCRILQGDGTAAGREWMELRRFVPESG